MNKGINSLFISLFDCHSLFSMSNQILERLINTTCRWPPLTQVLWHFIGIAQWVNAIRPVVEVIVAMMIHKIKRVARHLLLWQLLCAKAVCHSRCRTVMSSFVRYFFCLNFCLILKYLSTKITITLNNKIQDHKVIKSILYNILQFFLFQARKIWFQNVIEQMTILKLV